MNRIVWVALAVGLLGGCIVLRRPPSEVVVVRDRPSGPVHKAGPPPGQDVVRVKEIKAGEVRARVIHVKELKADRARIGEVIRVKNPAGNWGKGEIETDRVHADEIYAKEIKANLVIADQVFAHEIHIGERDGKPGRGRGRDRD